MDIISQLRPTREEIIFLERETKDFLTELNSKLKDARAVVGGSFAKNTFLKGMNEVDIFVKFDYKKYKGKSDKLSNILVKSLRRYKRIHGSRDYFQITKSKITFEIVPVLDIRNPKQALNVTDVSPLHAEYVKKHITKKQADEVRLLKQFCKANNLYGAESYIKGFSGYVLEILILHYKTFNNLLKHAKEWEEKVILDPAHYYKTKKELITTLNISKIYSPLILVDPVQPERNIAAALSEEKFEEFKRVAEAYIKKPNPNFFAIKKFDLASLKKYTILKVTPLEGKEDIVGAKLLKAFTFLKNSLRKEGFSLQDSNWYWNKDCYFYFKAKQGKLPLYKKHYGPPIKDAKNTESFKRKWRKYKIYKEGKRVFVLIPRKKRILKEYLKFLIKYSYVKERVKKIGILD